MLAVAIRSLCAEGVRELAESHGMGPSRLLPDAVLLFGGQVEARYDMGTASTEWRAQRRGYGSADTGK